MATIEQPLKAKQQAQPALPPDIPDYVTEILDRSGLKSSESPQAFIIIMTSYIEDVLTKLIKKQLVVSGGNQDELFGNSKPLFYFGPKIELAYRLGLISPDMRSLLNKLRKLRDKCAHSQNRIGFDDGPTKDLINSIHERLVDTYTGRTSGEKFLDIVQGVLITLWVALNSSKAHLSALQKEWLFRN